MAIFLHNDQTQDEVKIEFYPLEKRALWKERKVRALLYASGGIRSWQKMKALSMLMDSFVRYPDELEEFAEDPAGTAERWLRRSLQLL